jgi:dTDP-4-amino-4,6-dideoxygalactose transaminase
VSRQPLVDLGAQYREIRDELVPELEAIFAGGGFIGGERVRRFETDFARFCGRAHCVGVANGTDALTVGLRAIGIGPGDQVITVPFTFVATVEAIGHTGARPVLVDVRGEDLLIEPAALDAVSTARTRAVIAVHLYGAMADVERVGAWCRGRGIALIEDAAQAHGARLSGRRAGSFGDVGTFSFYPAKNLGAAGDAGALVTDRTDVAQRARLLSDHGQSARYQHEIEAYNSRLDAIQAAVLSAKLTRLDRWNAHRRTLAGLYRERLEKVAGVRLLRAPDDPEAHVYHLFVIRVAGRDAVREALTREGIETGLHYPVPVHQQPAYRHLGYGPGAFPEAEAAAREVLSLPLHEHMSEDAVHRVADAVERALRGR